MAESSSIETRHPLYLKHESAWRQLQHAFEGDSAIKRAGIVYLPPTMAMWEDGFASGKSDSPGVRNYNAYRQRARYPELVKEAIEAMLGVMHHEPPTIVVPTEMEPMIKEASVRGESLEMVLRRVNEEQLKMGRCGLLLDLPRAQLVTSDGHVAPGPTETDLSEMMAERLFNPFLSVYEALSIINWDEGNRHVTRPESLNLIVLDESGEERKSGGFDWDHVQKFRVLALGEIGPNEASGGDDLYRQGMFTDRTGDQLQYDDASMIEPRIREQALNRVPFVFANTKSISPEPDEPPLFGLHVCALDLYRQSADHKQNLHFQGQDTLVRIGVVDKFGDKVRVGAGARLDLPSGGDAKFIGISGQGLPEQRQQYENDSAAAERRAGRLLESDDSRQESGKALEIRVSARTASLNQIAVTGAHALETSLKVQAQWLGLSPEAIKEISVTPNMDFAGAQKDTEHGRLSLDLRKEGEITQKKNLEEQMRAGVLSPETDIDEQVTLTGDEREEARKEMQDAFGQPGGFGSEDPPNGPPRAGEDDEDEDEAA